MVLSESSVCWLAFLATLVALASPRPEMIFKALLELGLCLKKTDNSALEGANRHRDSAPGVPK